MNQYNTLFEQQSYTDALEYYKQVLMGDGAAWDFVILTASNEDQALAYSEQINYRKSCNQLPERTHFAVLPDPDGKRVGSGGATLAAIKYVFEKTGGFKGKKILVIHSGGDSKRIPQYSICGKLFSPVPRNLPSGRRSTLFDEFMIGMSTVAARISDGMLVCSGDVLLIFNALQIDFYTKGAAALSIKENVETGKNHGVYLKDKDGNVGKFLHKQTAETLKNEGAVDSRDKVDIDTGAVILDSNILTDLYSLIEKNPEKYINEKARLSFYADFLYPLATKSTLESFYGEAPEGEFTNELFECRTELWNTLHKYNMRLIRLSPASFIHFGTTKELLKLMTTEIGDYSFLGWSPNINSNVADCDYAVSNSYISRKAVIGKGSYIEDCYIHHDSVVGENCVISGITLNGEHIPDGTVMHGLKLKDGRFVVRIYGVSDNPKISCLFGKEISEPLWTAPIYPVCETIEEAVRLALKGESGGEKTSLKDSFNNADVTVILPWQRKLEDKIKAEKILQAIWDRKPVNDLKIKITDRVTKLLTERANTLKEQIPEEFEKKIRIYYYLAKLTKNQEMMNKCFDTVRNSVLASAVEKVVYNNRLKIKEDNVTVQLPVRVNWGGGWSDTPPYCIENGGTVLNAAVSLGGRLPIEVTLKRVDEPKIILASTDIGSYKEFSSIDELQDCQNPSDAFALHKAALIVCGVIPYKEKVSVEDITKQLGGGLYLNTRVVNIPKGSGLGTSSILAGACAKGIFQFMGASASEDEIYSAVLCMEQLMSTGGGWQDQVGGIAPGIKMITSQSGLKQQLKCTPLSVNKVTIDELNSRFCLIYTGQRRLARNLLREVIGKYIGNSSDTRKVLYDIQRLAVLMRFELEKGNINGFAELLNEHWELSKKLDMGCTNTCIEQIFGSIEDLIDGKMICGAGGGGFLQVILKHSIDKKQLRERLSSVFQDSGVDVWECKFE